MRKSVKILGRTVPVVVIALAVMGTGAFAALLTYYGTITATANVYQSILLDGKDINSGSLAVTDLISEPAPGGESFCFEHNLKNQMSVSGTVNFASDCGKDGNPDNCGGITKTYLENVPYSFSRNFCNFPGSLGVTVEDTGDALKWTYIYAASPTHTPKMTVAINYPIGYAITTFDDCSHDGWYYAPDGGAEVPFGPYSGGSYGGWVTTTAVGNVLTVEIKKSELGDSFHWHGYGNYNGNQVWIGGGTDSDCCVTYTYGYPYIEVNLKQALTPPVTLQSGETKYFSVCYGFAQAIAPGIYTITTNVVPQ